jgi:DivIVA domain-containing protein
LSKPFSAEEVRAARFSNRRRGFDVDEVMLFMNKVANDIQAFDGERASLRADLHTARNELERLRDQKSEAEPSPDRVEISVHAVGLLSQAQQTADSCVAEAEQYARELIEAARGQYRDILDRAQQAAAESVRHIEVTSPESGVTVPEVEYVRTYARVAQVQLRSVLDALTQEVDKLGNISQFDDHRPEPASEEMSWEPTNLVSLNVTRTTTESATATAELNSGYGGL